MSDVLYNQTSTEKAAIAKVFNILSQYKLPPKTLRRRRTGTNKDEFEYNLLSRPDKESNLHPFAYKIPPTQYDTVFASIMEATFEKGISFTFSEQLENKHGALVFDLDLHVDPERANGERILRKSELLENIQSEAQENGWSEDIVQEELRTRLQERSKKGRVLTKDALQSFLQCVAKTLSVFADPKKIKPDIPVTIDYHIRQRSEPKFHDFDNGQAHYDDGAHIQINLDCSVEQRILIRHQMMESDAMFQWYSNYICEYLYQRAYTTCPVPGTSAATSYKLNYSASSTYMDDGYAVSKIVDFAVCRGSSAFSVIGSHKKGYLPYVLSQYGFLGFRIKKEETLRPDDEEEEQQEEDDDDDEDVRPVVQIRVKCMYSLEDEGVLPDWKQEINRPFAQSIKGCMTIRELVMNNTISFSARSSNKRAYVSSSFLGSAFYKECMNESFPLWYRRHNRFYVPVEGVSLIPNALRKKKRQRNNNRRSFLDDEEEEDDDGDEIEGDDDDALAEIIAAEEENSRPGKGRRIDFGDDDHEEDYDDEHDELVRGGKLNAKKPKLMSSSSSSAKKRGRTLDDERAGGEEEADASTLSKKQKKAQKVLDEVEAAAKAARTGEEHHGAFDYRSFQDMHRGNLFMVTELDLMQCSCMEELDGLYNRFIQSLENDPPSSPGLNDDLRQAYMCTMALPEKFYCIGSREERIRVCWALHNISEYLLVVWVRFMFQRPEKDFSRMSEWIDNWNSARSDDDGSGEGQSGADKDTSRPGSGNGYQLGSLRHWVMINCPDKMLEITNSIFSTKVEKMIDDITINVMMASTVFNNQSRMKSICIGDFQMAQLAEFLVGDRIVLCSLPTSSNVIWMKYNDKTGLWRRHATGLSCELSVTLAQYFRNHLNAMGAKLAQIPQSGKPPAEMKKETEMLTRKMQEVLNVQTRLSNHTGKCMIINEAKNLLYRDNFLSQLDSNPFLFAFTNGVLDFSLSPPIFRKSEPLDYISVNCGNPYLEEYDGTSRTLRPDELKQVYENMDTIIYEAGVEWLEEHPDKFSHLENEEDRISEAGCDAIRADPSILFKALPERFQGIANEITEYMRQMFQDPITRSYAYKLTCLPLVGCTLKNQFAHLFTGKGKNGKSVFSVDLFKILYGGYYYAMDIRYWIQASGKAGGVQPELVLARTARWMPSFEPPKGSTLNENTTKLFVGGTDPINCRTLFEPPIQYIPQFTCAIVSNHNLGLESYDNGGTRRLRSLHFGTYFYDDESGPLQTNSGKPIYQFKKDPKLAFKMKKWGPVYLWMLVKLYCLIDGALPSLSEVPEVKFHTENFFNDFDIEGAFIRTYLRYDKDSMVLKCDLNKKYKEWYMNQYAKDPSNIMSLHQRMNEFVDSKQDQVFDDGWYGLKLLE